MSRYKDLVCKRIKTSKTIVIHTITKKYTTSTARSKFVRCIITHIWKNQATKGMKSSIRRRLTIQNLKWRLAIKKRSGQSVDNINCSTKRINPEFKWNIRVEEHCKTCFCYVA